MTTMENESYVEIASWLLDVQQMFGDEDNEETKSDAGMCRAVVARGHATESEQRRLFFLAYIAEK